MIASYAGGRGKKVQAKEVSPLTMYEFPPTEELSLDDFDQLAFNRLRGRSVCLPLGCPRVASGLGVKKLWRGCGGAALHPSSSRSRGPSVGLPDVARIGGCGGSTSAVGTGAAGAAAQGRAAAAAAAHAAVGAGVGAGLGAARESGVPRVTQRGGFFLPPRVTPCFFFLPPRPGAPAPRGPAAAPTALPGPGAAPASNPASSPAGGLSSC